MDDLSWVIPLAVMILYGILSLFNRKTPPGQRKPPPPPPGETGGPKLPYENLVDQVFGGYIRRRKREYEAQRRRLVVEDEEGQQIELILDEGDEEEEERRPPPRPAPVPKPEVRILEEAPVAVRPREWAEKAERVSLEERLFGSRRYSTGAKLVLANEILQRPKARRR